MRKPETEPRTLDFGQLQVTENLNTDFLTEEERSIYHRGFSNLTLMTNSRGLVGKMMFTSPHISSAIIGIQPYATLSGEGAYIGLIGKDLIDDFEDQYGLLTRIHSGPSGPRRREMIINRAACNYSLHLNQEFLGIRIPEQISASKLDAVIVELFNNASVDQRGVICGILSGFPAADVLKDDSDPTKISCSPQPKLEIASFPQIQSRTQALREVDTIDAKRKYTCPQIGPIRSPLECRRKADVLVRGFGLLWAVSSPVSESTFTHCQRLMQLDRELGLLQYFEEARRNLSVEDSIVEMQSVKAA